MMWLTSEVNTIYVLSNMPSCFSVLRTAPTTSSSAATKPEIFNKRNNVCRLVNTVIETCDLKQWGLTPCYFVRTWASGFHIPACHQGNSDVRVTNLDFKLSQFCGGPLAPYPPSRISWSLPFRWKVLLCLCGEGCLKPIIVIYLPRNFLRWSWSGIRGSKKLCLANIPGVFCKNIYLYHCAQRPSTYILMKITKSYLFCKISRDEP